jgi:rare lipoprotein A
MRWYLRSLTKAFILSVMVVLVGFTIVTNEGDIPESAKYEDEIRVNEELSNFNTSIIKYIDKGEMTASWYGRKFHGRKTANGEVYNQMAFTAAHKDLRFGTLLRVTNPNNDQSVIVRINDRGPYIKGRQLDLSKASASALGLVEKGVAKVRVEQLALKGVNFPVISFN